MRTSCRAFTLIELLIVVGILALLLALVAPQITGRLGESRPVVTRQQIEHTVTALESFYLDVGRYPTTDEGLSALISQPSGLANWKGPYLRRTSIPKDGWGNDLRYRAPAEGQPFPFEVFSYGRNNQPGGEGEDAEIFSWQ